jgi:hypothetical protein
MTTAPKEPASNNRVTVRGLAIGMLCFGLTFAVSAGIRHLTNRDGAQANFGLFCVGSMSAITGLIILSRFRRKN